MNTNPAFFKNFFKTLLITGLFISTQAKSQTYKELVLQLRSFKIEKQIDDFKAVITDYKAIQITGYCNHLSCVLLKVDRNVQPDDAKFLQALKDAGFAFEVKANTTIAQVLTACRDDQSPRTDSH